MHSYRVTKYDPQYRSDNGTYLKDEWISVSDVGNSYDGKTLDFSEYLRYENAYISAVHIAMKANDVFYMKINELEKATPDDHPDISINHSRKYIDAIKNRSNVSYSNIDFLTRLILREMLWCKLVCDNMFVHFGYDYYMYIGSRKNLDIESKLISDLGLFVEEMPSPYL